MLANNSVGDGHTHLVLCIVTGFCAHAVSLINYAAISGELVELTVKLATAADGERRAQEQLTQRNDEQTAEVNDLHIEVSWFRGEYDQLLKKVSSF